MEADMDYAPGHPDWDWAIENGHDRLADKVILVDFDGTIFPFGDLFDYDSEPLPGAKNALARLALAGWEIRIFSSRISPEWLAARGQTREDQTDYMAARLTQFGIPFSDFVDHKAPSEWIVDDKALPFNGRNWKHIAAKVLGEHIHEWEKDGDFAHCYCGDSMVSVLAEEWG
jgi:hypothetical protein